jgi:hypothetical protein
LCLHLTVTRALRARPLWRNAFVRSSLNYYSQILQLTHLAPEIQEQLLFLPPTRQGFDRVLEKHVRPLARVVDWQKQKQLFRAIEDQLSS